MDYIFLRSLPKGAKFSHDYPAYGVTVYSCGKYLYAVNPFRGIIFRVSRSYGITPFVICKILHMDGYSD